VRGNVVDMAVGIIVGAAFNGVVSIARTRRHDAAPGPVDRGRGLRQPLRRLARGHARRALTPRSPPPRPRALAVEEAGFYPTDYAVSYDAASATYDIVMDLTERQ
jgi:hypothetical protein